MTGTAYPRRAVATQERRITPDLARGFMLLLIAMAYAPMYLPHADVGGYGVRPGGGGADQVVSFLAALFLENRAFPMFAVLFGYGMVMLTTRQQAMGASEREIRDLLRRRALWLLAFGLVHAILVFPGEILAAYGLGTLILGWLLFRPDRTIVRTVAALAPFYMVTVVLLALAMAAEGGAYAVPGYRSADDWIMRVVGAPFAALFNTFGYPLLILLAIGMWLGRRQLLEQPGQNRQTLLRLAILGVGLSVLGALPVALAGAGAFAVDDTVFALLSALQILTGIFGGVGYVACFGLLGMHLEARGGGGPIVRALVAAGQRSLTVYLMASIGVALVLHSDLFGAGEHLHRAGAMAVAVAVWLFCVAVARLLDKAGKRGPADALLRRLVYKRPGT